LDDEILFTIDKRHARAFYGRCFSMIGDILSRPDAVDFHKDMAEFNSDIVKTLVRT